MKPLEGLTFLLAEDNVTNQLVASQMLKTLGGEVEIAADGALALQLLEQRSFDILLVDIEMPRVSGLDVIRAVRASEGERAQAPIIALTAYAMDEHKSKILGVGADGLIAKPITSISEFGDRIREIAANAMAARSGQAVVADEPRKEAPSAATLMERERSGSGAGPQIDDAVFETLATSLGSTSLAMLLRKAQSDLADAGNQIEMAAETGDIVLMRGASHVAISVAGSVGAIRLQRQSEALNRLAHLEELAAAEVLTKELLKELEGVIGFIRSKREDY